MKVEEDPLYIVIDLGATKCAAALMSLSKENSAISLIKQTSIALTECNAFNQLTSAIEECIGMSFKSCHAVCIAASGRYNGKTLYHERGYPYEIDIANTASGEKWPHTAVVHDYTPIACASYTDFALCKENVMTVREGKANSAGRRLALGVGSGLGIKDIVYHRGEFVLGENEAGHCGIVLPPQTSNERYRTHLECHHFFQKNDLLEPGEGFMFESILSGKGLSRLHQFVTGNNQVVSPGDICKHADSIEFRDTWRLFAWYLGLFTGTCELMFMPSGGIWIAGGVIQKNIHLFSGPEFLEGVQASPSYEVERSQFPIMVMTRLEHVFYGGAYYIHHQLNREWS